MIHAGGPPGETGGAVTPTAQDYLQYALEFRVWGWSVFPLGPDKRPGAGWKRLRDRRPTDRELGRLFGRAPLVGLAVVTGSASGGRDWVLACRDFDTADGYRRWAARPRPAGSRPPGPTQSSTSGAGSAARTLRPVRGRRAAGEPAALRRPLAQPAPGRDVVRVGAAPAGFGPRLPGPGPGRRRVP